MRGLGAGAAMLFVLLAGCADGGRDRDPAPEEPDEALACSGVTFTMGDRWTYRIESDPPREFTTRVEGIEARTADNRTLEVVVTRETGELVSPGKPATYERVEARRTCDWALVAIEMTVTTDEGSSRTALFFKEPCRELRWPLQVGASWTVACEGLTEQGNETNESAFRATYRVLGREHVVVPAGSFQAHRVEGRLVDRADAPPNVRLIAAEACGDVRREAAQLAQVLLSVTCASTRTT